MDERASAPVDEGWILAGTIDGETAAPLPLERVAGLPHLLRSALTLTAAGAGKVVVVWLGGTEPPDVSEIAADPRLGVPLVLCTEPPSGDASDRIVAVRGDRIYHRDLPKQVCEHAGPERGARVIDDRAIDAVWAAPRDVAARIAAGATEPGGLDTALSEIEARGELAVTAAPWCGFSVPARDRRARLRAEWKLCWSLRKPGDGIAASVINRRISLPLSFLLCRTRIKPNHVTLCCLLTAFIGGIVVATGGYTRGVIGLGLFELASIIDGIDGELSRLESLGSRLGQWMDTVTDDVSNVFFCIGVTLNLCAAGVDWAAPVGATAVAAFATTQLVQYYYLVRYYDSGDLAANPWALQAAPPFREQTTGLAKLWAFVPRLLKRDFTITLFFALAIAGRLELALLIFSGGAVSFFVVLAFQFARHRPRGPSKGAQSP